MFVKNSTMTKKGQFFSDFKAMTKEEWIEKIQKDLKGKSFEKLFWHPEKKLEIAPFYMAKDLSELPHLQDNLVQKTLTTPRQEWKIAEKFNLENKNIVSQIRIALENNVHSLIIEITEKGLKNIPDLLNILKPQNKKIQKISFRGQNSILEKCVNDNLVIDFISTNPKIQFLFGFNFLSELTSTGKQSLETEFITTLKKQFALLPNVRFLLVNGNDFHNAGASVVQEIAYTLAIGNTYQSFFETDENIASRIEFLFSAGNNYFFEIAKLRAFRILWAKLLQHHNTSFNHPETIYLSSETSIFNKTIYDPYVNMLRNTTEAMAAILGGTDELTVLPFNFLFEENSDFGKRIARNIQHLLRHETHLNTVNDIPAGSYYIENLTHLLSENIWNLFIEIENNGGYEKLANSNYIKQTIEENATKIIQDFNTRKKVLVGINNYPNLSDDTIEKINSGVLKQKSGNNKGLQFFRIAEQIETIRLKTEKLFHKKPKVFLFTYGNLPLRRARAGFALNFLGAADFDILDNNGFASINDGMAAFKKSGADILVVCSSDEEYSEIIPAISNGLSEKILIIAGNPEKIDVSTNVDFFIFSGSNIFDTLQKIQEQLLKIKEIV